MINRTFYYKENLGEAVNCPNLCLDCSNISSDNESDELTLHREDGPAYIMLDEGSLLLEEWHLEGKNHRVKEPAITHYYSTGKIFSEKWIENDNLSIGKWYYSSGIVKTIEYYQHGLLHREDGPAHIDYDEKGNEMVKSWYLEGKKLK